MANPSHIRNYLSLVMVLVVGPIMLLLYLAFDLKHAISDQILRWALFYIPIMAFFVLKSAMRLFSKQLHENSSEQKHYSLNHWLEICALTFVCFPAIYIFFFFWLGVKK